jgi:hypothetical protein
MITREIAIELAQKYFKESSITKPHMAYAAVDENNIVEASFGWILPWNGRPFLESGDFRFAIQGHCPLVVFKLDGRIIHLPTLNRGEKLKFKSKGFHGTIEHRIASLAETLG